MSRGLFTCALFGALPLAQGCASEAADVQEGTTIEVDAARLSDSLLNRPELQAIVDLQVQRDGGGLVELLDDDSPLVRARALHALASVQDTAAVPAMLPLLRDPEWTVRRDAALALGQVGVAGPAGVMLSALEEETEAEVRRRLIEGVAKIGDGVALARLHASAPRPGEAADRMLAFGRFGIRGVHHPDVVRTLVEALSDGDPLVREHAAYYFGRVTELDAWRPVAAGVREALDARDPADPAAMHLLAGLGRLADPGDRSRFMEWAAHGADWRVRTNAVRALGSQPDGARVRDALFDALADPSTHVAVTAATALAGRELPSGELERLRRWIDAHPAEWRVAAPLLSTLVRGGHTGFVIEWTDRWGARAADVVPRSRGLNALVGAPGEEAFRVLLESAAASNRRLAAAAVEALAARWPSDRRAEATHARYFEAFRRAIRSGDAASARVAAEPLASEVLRPFGAVEVLETGFREMATPEDVAPMTAILDALGEIADDRSVALLREALDHPHAAIRTRAARSLRIATGEDGTTAVGDDQEIALEAPGGPGEVGEAAPPAPAIDWTTLRELGRHPRLILETTKGRIVVVLAAEEAPMTVQAITNFAREGRYDGLPFHRVVPNFVIQGGDFARGDGAGGPASRIRSEFSGILYGRGVIGMASSGKDTESSQFFLTHAMQPHLDGGYTAFGWVVEGMEVVDSIYEEDRVVRASVRNGAP